jgi:protein-tyrosine phosphatase
MQPLAIAGVANAYVVDDGALWRGAQPEDPAWKHLAAAGCKAVLDLNTCGVDAIARQKKMVEDAGMAYEALSWSGLYPPSQEQMRVALGWIFAQLAVGHGPVFVHCAHGSDRTGALCACWRMRRDGWDLAAALDEAFLSLGVGGMHEFWFVLTALKFARDLRP